MASETDGGYDVYVNGKKQSDIWGWRKKIKYDPRDYNDTPKPNPKEIAKQIYDKLITNDEVMHELNVMLRKHKLEQLKK